jgi:hypothetical protein
MKNQTILTGILIMLVCGLVMRAAGALLTPKQVSQPAAAPMEALTQSVIAPVPDNMAVSVTDSYYAGYTNVELVIDAKTGLILAWKEKFHGATNSFHFRATNQMEFYRAHYRYAGTTN